MIFQICLGGNVACPDLRKHPVPNLFGGTRGMSRWGKMAVSGFQTRKRRISKSVLMEIGHVRISEKVNFLICLVGNGACEDSRKIKLGVQKK